MTQVLTVSPTTAAYVSDAYKPNTSKANPFNPMAEAITEWHDEALAKGDFADRSLLTLVTPPALALTFLTVEPHKLPQVTEEQATAEYKANDYKPGEQVPDEFMASSFRTAGHKPSDE